MGMTATQFKEYSEAMAENKILHKKIGKLEQQLTSRKRQVDKLLQIINDLRWGQG